MKLDEAKAECERWFAYLKRQEEKCVAMQKIASERRQGLLDEAEGRRRQRSLDNGLTVYDGANLAKAVRVLLKQDVPDDLLKILSDLWRQSLVIESAVREANGADSEQHKAAVDLIARAAKVLGSKRSRANECDRHHADRSE